jgi:hypothetical protein
MADEEKKQADGEPATEKSPKRKPLNRKTALIVGGCVRLHIGCRASRDRSRAFWCATISSLLLAICWSKSIAPTRNSA